MQRPQTHVITLMPRARELFYSFAPGLVLVCWAGAWLLGRLLHWLPDMPLPSRSSIALIGLWWIWDPLCLFLFAHVTGVSLFVPRYFSLALPGAALAAAALIARHVPLRLWKPLAAIIGAAGLGLCGSWQTVWPQHANADWRGAARVINQLAPDSTTPVICPSPFIEAKPPLWRPGYPLPAVLYSHLAVYPLRATTYPFPLDSSPEAEQFAAKLSQSTLAPSGHFLLYSHRDSARLWAPWFQRRPEFAGWTSRRPGDFGDVVVMEFVR